MGKLLELLEFLSTPSARRATGCRPERRCGHPISIHALREEGDAVRVSSLVCSRGFLSTPSARRATLVIVGGFGVLQFLSTPSARRATPWSLLWR